MADAGSHSPSTLSGDSELDAGAHSPSTLSGETLFDNGAHSPSRLVGSIGAFVVPAALSPGTAGNTVPDDGGEIVEVGGSWPSKGPYRVRLVAADGSLFPYDGYCYSGKVGQASDCYTDQIQARLRFVTPPAPAGMYDLRIDYGAAFGTTLTVAAAIRVLPRTWDRATFRLRRYLPSPPYDKTGAYSVTQEADVPA